MHSGWSDLDNYYSKRAVLNTIVSNNQSCYSDYSILNDDTKNYSAYWFIPGYEPWSIVNTLDDFNINFSNSSNHTISNITSSISGDSKYSKYIIDANLSKAFNFTRSKYLKDNSYAGMFASYLSGGYVYRMMGDLQTVQNSLTSLQQMGWIDKKTRAVFFDFTLYNPNINLFSYCSLVFELLPSGGIIPTANVVTMNLWSGSREVLATGCMAAYLVVIVVLMTKEIKAYKILKKQYFMQFWIYVDWTLFGCSWTALPMYLYKLYAMHSLLNEVAQNKIQYTNLSGLSGWNTTLTIFLSMCTFLATIKLIRLLRFNKKLSYLTTTIKNCSKDLVSFMVVFLILWLAYVQLMYIFYYEKTIEFASFTKSMVTNFLIILGKFNLSPLIEANYTASAIIFSSYNILIVMIMVNFLITIISDSFAAARVESGKIKEVSLFEHLTKRIKSKMPDLSRNKIYVQDKKVNYSSYIENTQLFEIYTKKLVDDLKDRIYIERESNAAFDKI